MSSPVRSRGESFLPQLNLNQLRVFHAAARCKSFTLAAEDLHLTQPGISKHIKELERHWGTLLFERRGRSLELTSAGRILYQATQEISASLKKAEMEMKDLANSPPQLSLAATFTAGFHIVPALLAEFKRQHPEVETTLDIFSAKLIEERLLDYSFDLGLIGHEIRNRKLVVTEFLSDDLVVIVSRHHAWASRTQKITPTELSTEPFIATATGSGTRRVVEDRLRRNGVKLTKVLDLGNMEAVKRGVEAGLGISILSRGVIQRELSARTLSMVPLAGRDMQRRFSVLYRKEKYLSRAAKVFIEHLCGLRRRKRT